MSSGGMSIFQVAMSLMLLVDFLLSSTLESIVSWQNPRGIPVPFRRCRWSTPIMLAMGKACWSRVSLRCRRTPEDQMMHKNWKLQLSAGHIWTEKTYRCYRRSFIFRKEVNIHATEPIAKFRGFLSSLQTDDDNARLKLVLHWDRKLMASTLRCTSHCDCVTPRERPHLRDFVTRGLTPTKRALWHERISKAAKIKSDWWSFVRRSEGFTLPLICWMVTSLCSRIA